MEPPEIKSTAEQQTGSSKKLNDERSIAKKSFFRKLFSRADKVNKRLGFSP
jgi:hypothetical protein